MILIPVHFSVKLDFCHGMVAVPKTGWRYLDPVLLGCISFFYATVAGHCLKDTNDKLRLLHEMAFLRCVFQVFLCFFLSQGMGMVQSYGASASSAVLSNLHFWLHNSLYYHYQM